MVGTNENFYSRITAVQIGMHTTYAERSEKQKLRDALNSEVEKFLAAKGEIKVLPVGFTHFPDGDLPKAKGVYVDRKQGEKERNEKIERINERVRAQREQREKQRETAKLEREALKVEKKEKRNAQIKEQITMLNHFFERSTHGDLGKLCRLIGVSEKTIRNARCGAGKMSDESWIKTKEALRDFKYGERLVDADLKKQIAAHPKPLTPKTALETQRRSLVQHLGREAKARGDRVFEAPCAKHGMTAYRIYNGASRCLECRLTLNKQYLDISKDQIQKDRKERKEYNVLKMNQALEKGSKDFEGLCRNCGYVPFRAHRVTARNKFEYRCVGCQNRAYQKQIMIKKNRNLQVAA